MLGTDSVRLPKTLAFNCRAERRSGAPKGRKMNHKLDHLKAGDLLTFSNRGGHYSRRALYQERPVH